MHNSFGYLFHHLISLARLCCSKYSVLEKCFEHFYVKVKFTLKEGLVSAQLLHLNESFLLSHLKVKLRPWYWSGFKNSPSLRVGRQSSDRY